MRTRPNYLFASGDLSEYLRQVADSVRKAVDEIDRYRFSASTDHEIVQYILSKHTIEPLTLLEDHARMDERETEVDVSGDQNRIFSPGRSGPFHVPGIEVTVTIPFTGLQVLWQLRPNRFTSVFPVGVARAGSSGEPGELIITLTKAHDADQQQFKTEYEYNLNSIREYVGWSKTQVEQSNGQLADLARSAVEGRRSRLEKHGNLSALLDIPLREKKGAPSIEPIKVEPRVTAPLPPPPKSGLKPEPGISQELYEKILQMIRHQGRTFETTPKTYAVHDEEGLRDIMLAQLNMHFQGAAAGEVFRKRGKTDIRIEDEDRNAFVGECKVWGGAKKIDEAIDQLTGYLTWRDCKSALVIFNKNTKGFSGLLEKVPERLCNHRFFVSEESLSENGEWRFVLRSEEDEGRRITVHVFLYDLYVA